MSKERSRIMLLSHIAQFSLGRVHDSGYPFPPLRDMAFQMTDNPPNGALVALSAAPPSKWYISWVIESRWPEGHAGTTWTLESIEDGELCDWRNVSFAVYSPEQVRLHPEWRWTDEQHDFNKRWQRLCREEQNGWAYPIAQTRFEESAANAPVRLRYDFDNMTPPAYAEIRDWKSASDEILITAYLEAVATVKSQTTEAKQP